MRLFALIAPLLVVSLALAVGPPGRPSAEVQKLFDQLGDDDLETRKAAMAKLEGLGEPVVLALRKVGRDHPEVDVRLRAHAVAGAIEAKLYGEVRRFVGHTGEAVVVEASPDGKTLASGAWTGGRDPEVRLWDVKTGKQVKSIKGHTDGVSALAFLAQGKQLLTASGDGTVRLWDVAKGTEVRQMIGHPAGLQGLAVSSDGKTAVSCDFSSLTLFSWDVGTGKLLRNLGGHTAVIRGVAFVPRSNRCLSASFDGTVRVWDARTFRQLASLSHGRPAWFVAARPDGKEAASVGEDGKLRLWDLETFKLVRAIDAHAQGTHGVAYSPNGKRLLTCSYDHTVKLWDAQTGKLVQQMEGHTERTLWGTFLPDGRHAVSASSDKTLRLWRLRR